ncbi:protein FAM83F-like [Petromyzon marinus]|uniref:protein FAM83F-like n=1 Tax=Petromyzon marinus TaxID=7757 RepID=UPI003F6FC9A7
MAAGPRTGDANGLHGEMGLVLAGGGGRGEEENGEDEEDMGSGTYWPVFSDVTVPELELGWPSVARSLGTTVSCYFQPPLEEGEPSIKEVVRKLIRSASKVVAVAMDVFSDVDLFSELVEVSGPTRRVPVYLVLDAIAFPLFWDMCSGMRLRARDLQVR